MNRNMQIMELSMDDEIQEPQQQQEAVLYHPSPFLMQPQESIVFHDSVGDDAEISLANSSIPFLNHPFSWSKHRGAKPSTSYVQSKTTSDSGSDTYRRTQHKSSKHHDKQIMIEERQDSISEIHHRIQKQYAKIEEEGHRYGLEPPETTQYSAAAAPSISPLPPTRTEFDREATTTVDPPSVLASRIRKSWNRSKAEDGTRQQKRTPQEPPCQYPRRPDPSMINMKKHRSQHLSAKDRRRNKNAHLAVSTSQRRQVPLLGMKIPVAIPSNSPSISTCGMEEAKGRRQQHPNSHHSSYKHRPATIPPRNTASEASTPIPMSDSKEDMQIMKEVPPQASAASRMTTSTGVAATPSNREIQSRWSSMIQWGIPLPRTLQKNPNNHKDASILLEKSLKRHLVWIRYHPRGNVGTSRGYLWPAIVYPNYRRLLQDPLLSKHVWYQIPFFWKRLELATMLVWNPTHVQNHCHVARILGRGGPSIEIVELMEDPKTKATDVDPKRDDQPPLFWPLNDPVVMNQAINEMTLNPGYFRDDPSLFLDWHRAMDDMETLLVECLGIPLQDDVSRTQDHLGVGEKRQHEAKYGEENSIIAAVAKPHLQSSSWLARARDVEKERLAESCANCTRSVYDGVESVCQWTDSTIAGCVRRGASPGQHRRRFSRDQPMTEVSKIGRQSTKRWQHSS